MAISEAESESEIESETDLQSESQSVTEKQSESQSIEKIEQSDKEQESLSESESQSHSQKINLDQGSQDIKEAKDDSQNGLDQMVGWFFTTDYAVVTAFLGATGGRNYKNAVIGMNFLFDRLKKYEDNRKKSWANYFTKQPEFIGSGPGDIGAIEKRSKAWWSFMSSSKVYEANQAAYIVWRLNRACYSVGLFPPARYPSPEILLGVGTFGAIIKCRTLDPSSEGPGTKYPDYTSSNSYDQKVVDISEIRFVAVKLQAVRYRKAKKNRVYEVCQEVTHFLRIADTIPDTIFPIISPFRGTYKQIPSVLRDLWKKHKSNGGIQYSEKTQWVNFRTKYQVGQHPPCPDLHKNREGNSGFLDPFALGQDIGGNFSDSLRSNGELSKMVPDDKDFDKPDIHTSWLKKVWKDGQAHESLLTDSACCFGKQNEWERKSQVFTVKRELGNDLWGIVHFYIMEVGKDIEQEIDYHILEDKPGSYPQLSQTDDMGANFHFHTQWFVQLVFSLWGWHSYGVIHDDLKPGNVLYETMAYRPDEIYKRRNFGRVFPMDIGTIREIKRVEKEGSSSGAGRPFYKGLIHGLGATSDGSFNEHGTPQYTPPEYMCTQYWHKHFENYLRVKQKKGGIESTGFLIGDSDDRINLKEFAGYQGDYGSVQNYMACGDQAFIQSERQKLGQGYEFINNSSTSKVFVASPISADATKKNKLSLTDQFAHPLNLLTRVSDVTRLGPGSAPSWDVWTLGNMLFHSTVSLTSDKYMGPLYVDVQPSQPYLYGIEHDPADLKWLSRNPHALANRANCIRIRRECGLLEQFKVTIFDKKPEIIKIARSNSHKAAVKDFLKNKSDAWAIKDLGAKRNVPVNFKVNDKGTELIENSKGSSWSSKLSSSGASQYMYPDLNPDSSNCIRALNMVGTNLTKSTTKFLSLLDSSSSDLTAHFKHLFGSCDSQSNGVSNDVSNNFPSASWIPGMDLMNVINSMLDLNLDTRGTLGEVLCSPFVVRLVSIAPPADLARKNKQWKSSGGYGKSPPPVPWVCAQFSLLDSTKHKLAADKGVSFHPPIPNPAVQRTVMQAIPRTIIAQILKNYKDSSAFEANVFSWKPPDELKSAPDGWGDEDKINPYTLEIIGSPKDGPDSLYGSAVLAWQKLHQQLALSYSQLRVGKEDALYHHENRGSGFDVADGDDTSRASRLSQQSILKSGMSAAGFASVRSQITTKSVYESPESSSKSSSRSSSRGSSRGSSMSMSSRRGSVAFGGSGAPPPSVMKNMDGGELMSLYCSQFASGDCNNANKTFGYIPFMMKAVCSLGVCLVCLLCIMMCTMGAVAGGAAAGQAANSTDERTQIVAGLGGGQQGPQGQGGLGKDLESEQRQIIMDDRDRQRIDGAIERRMERHELKDHTLEGIVEQDSDRVKKSESYQSGDRGSETGIEDVSSKQKLKQMLGVEDSEMKRKRSMKKSKVEPSKISKRDFDSPKTESESDGSEYESDSGKEISDQDDGRITRQQKRVTDRGDDIDSKKQESEYDTDSRSDESEDEKGIKKDAKKSSAIGSESSDSEIIDSSKVHSKMSQKSANRRLSSKQRQQRDNNDSSINHNDDNVNNQDHSRTSGSTSRHTATVTGREKVPLRASKTQSQTRSSSSSSEHKTSNYGATDTNSIDNEIEAEQERIRKLEEKLNEDKKGNKLVIRKKHKTSGAKYKTVTQSQTQNVTANAEPQSDSDSKDSEVKSSKSESESDGASDVVEDVEDELDLETQIEREKKKIEQLEKAKSNQAQDRKSDSKPKHNLNLKKVKESVIAKASDSSSQENSKSQSGSDKSGYSDKQQQSATETESEHNDNDGTQQNQQNVDRAVSSAATVGRNSPEITNNRDKNRDSGSQTVATANQQNSSTGNQQSLRTTNQQDSEIASSSSSSSQRPSQSNFNYYPESNPLPDYNDSMNFSAFLRQLNGGNQLQSQQQNSNQQGSGSGPGHGQQIYPAATVHHHHYYPLPQTQQLQQQQNQNVTGPTPFYNLKPKSQVLHPGEAHRSGRLRRPREREYQNDNIQNDHHNGNIDDDNSDLDINDDNSTLTMNDTGRLLSGASNAANHVNNMNESETMTNNNMISAAGANDDTIIPITDTSIANHDVNIDEYPINIRECNRSHSFVNSLREPSAFYQSELTSDCANIMSPMDVINNSNTVNNMSDSIGQQIQEDSVNNGNNNQIRNHEMESDSESESGSEDQG